MFTNRNVGKTLVTRTTGIKARRNAGMAAPAPRRSAAAPPEPPFPRRAALHAACPARTPRGACMRRRVAPLRAISRLT